MISEIRFQIICKFLDFFFLEKKKLTGPKLYCDKFNLPVDFTKFYIDYYQQGNNEKKFTMFKHKRLISIF